MGKENIITAAGTPEGAGKGHLTRKDNAANSASEAAHQASMIAANAGNEDDHKTAADLHNTASDAHKAAMLAHAAAGNEDEAADHAKAMVAHDACADAHGGCDASNDNEAAVTAALEKLSEVVKAGGPGSGRKATSNGYVSGQQDELDKPKRPESMSWSPNTQSASAERATSLAEKVDKPALHDRAAEMHENAAKTHDASSRMTDYHKAMANYHTAVGQELRAQKTSASAHSATDTIHCRAAGNALPRSKPWSVDEPVEFTYMPAGVHTINAGFRSGSINLTIEVDPDRDAPVCNASMTEVQKEAPRQKLFGCFEHEEKTASVWAQEFKPGPDGIVLVAEPSEAGAKAVNGKNHRSWSPSFNTNAEYSKCQCRRCDKGIKACKCGEPAYYFPDGARGSESNPAHITGVDFCLGTLTNKPAFRAMPPVKARDKVTAGGPGSGRKPGNGPSPEAASSYRKAADSAAADSKDAYEKSAALPDNATHQEHERAALAHSQARVAHEIAAQKAGENGVGYHTNMAAQHQAQMEAHKNDQHFPNGNNPALNRAPGKGATFSKMRATYKDAVTASVADDSDLPPQAPDEDDVEKETAASQMATKKAILQTTIAKATEDAYPDGSNHGTKQSAHYNARWAHEEAAAKASAGPVKDFHTESATYHQECATKHAAVTATSPDAELDTIFANVRKIETADDILARLTPLAARVTGASKDMDGIDAILAKYDGKVTAGGPGSGRHAEGGFGSKFKKGDRVFYRSKENYGGPRSGSGTVTKVGLNVSYGDPEENKNWGLVKLDNGETVETHHSELRTK